jgi:signal transduction histidine kinase
LEEIEIADLVERAWGAGVSAAPGRAGSPLSITIDVPRGLIVRVDPRRMVQVLRNLLVNAIAHANHTIHVSASQHEIRVADDGPGVPPGHEEKIFDRFHRVDPSRSRATGGAGLGLAIAKELVELHGGTIRYERPAFIISL